MTKKQFQAESKKLLEMMINSIYTQKEIFLRELISNASDAIDKLYYRALTDDSLDSNKDNYYIKVKLDKENRQLTISDTGIGMSKEDLENNLGIIAKSGSLAFKEETELEEDHEIIGQFGVGFYSAFMVADLVTVISKGIDSDTAYKWESEGVDGYTIEPAEKATVGTDIILKIKENDEEEDYDQYLEDYRIQEIIKKYSDFIRQPIKMDMTTQKPKEDNDEEFEEVIEEQTINTMIPIWRKSKSELTDEDYENFYNEKRYGFDKPLSHIHIKVDGTLRYNSILFIPERTPFDFYTQEYEKGLELYSNGVLIMDKCADLLPDHFSFVKGMVDSEDLSLNISRELLQHDRQLKQIARNIKNKIKSELKKLLENDREKYEAFFDSFGRQLKFGVYNEFGAHKDDLQDLLLFYSGKEDKLMSLDEYVSNMPEEQKYIYYATGETADKIAKMPQVELVTDQGYDLLYFTEDVDEFAIKMLMNYKEKEFRNVSSGDLGIEADEVNEKVEKEEAENKALFDEMKNLLTSKVKDVKASKRLKTHPVCFSVDGDVSIEMEKVLSAMPNNQGVQAEKVLEININHNVYNSLKTAFENDKEKFALYTDLLYNQALLIEGLAVEDPVELSNKMCEIMN